MRKIKFRAKRIDMDRWVYGQYFITPLTDENSGTKPNVGWFFLTGETRHCIVQNNVAFVINLNTLGQYTGLKDKNGVEIYEGDIVKITFVDGIKENFEVYYETDRARFSMQDVNKNVWGFVNSKETEIIGNIYETAELLESDGG